MPLNNNQTPNVAAELSSTTDAMFEQTPEQQIENEILAEYYEEPQVQDTLTPEVEAQIDSEIDNEIAMQQKYGNNVAEATALGAARGLSFGVSDQILAKIIGKERLKEVKDRQKISSLTGEVLGTVAPLVASGGTGLLAKGAQTAGAGVLGTAKLGLVAEAMTAKTLAKLTSETASKRLVSKIISKSLPAAAQGATEGALYGVGQLISEDALGDNELTAENILSYAGTGALLGGAVGGVIGAVPELTGAVAGRTKSVISNIEKQTKLSNPQQAATELLGMSPADIVKFKSTHPDVYEALPNFMVEKVKMGKWKQTDSDLFEKMLAAKKEAGEAIGSTMDKLESAGVENLSALPTANGMFGNIAKHLDENYLQKHAGKSLLEGELKPIQNLFDEVLTKAKSTDLMLPSELKSFMNYMDDAAKYGKAPGEIKMINEAAREIRSMLRDEVDNIALKLDQVGNTSLASELKAANKDYRMSTSVLKYIDKKAAKPMRVGSLTDMIAFAAGMPGGISMSMGLVGAKKFLESDLLKRITVFKHVEKRAAQNQQKIEKSVKSFFTGKRVVAPATEKFLINSELSRKNEEGKKSSKPANKKEAFTNISNNLNRLVQNPDQVFTNLAKGTYSISNAAPKSTDFVVQKTLTAMNFLHTKLPTTRAPKTGTSKFDREYMPSSLELAKFERYVETVENPMSVMDDLAAGTMTREQVETLQEVYPKIYQQIQQLSMQQVSDPETKLSYNQKVQLGILLNIPTDASLSPESIRQLQSQFQQQMPQNESQNAPAVNPTVSGLQNANFSGRIMTDTQKVNARK